MCGLHYWGHCNFVLFSHCLNNVSNNPRSKYKHEIARCNFWNSKYMVEIELGENDTALVQGQTSRQCSKASRLRLEVLSKIPEAISGVFCWNWTSSISIIYFEFQKLHRAISCLYFDRGLFEASLKKWRPHTAWLIMLRRLKFTTN